MSHYIYCPGCKGDSLDVDTLQCDCGYYPGAKEEAQVKVLQQAIRQMRTWIALHEVGELSAEAAFREIKSDIDRCLPSASAPVGA